MKSLLLSSYLFLLSSFVSHAAKTVTLLESNGGSDGVEVTFTPVDTDKLSVTVKYEGDAYVALAFSDDAFMANSIAVIGQLSDNSVLKYEMLGYFPPTVLPDDRQTLTDASITYDGAVTTLQFTKLLVEDSEPVISVTEDTNFLFAVGTDGVDRALAQHNSARRGAVVVNVSSSEEEAATPEEVEDDIEAGKDVSEFVDLGNGRRQLSQTLADGIEAVIIADDTAERLEVTVVYEGESYVAFAFSEDDQMPGSIGVIGLPGAGTVLKYDLFGRETPTVLPNNQQTLENTSIEFDGAFTTLTFTKLIAEDNEPEIFLRDNNFFLWAHGIEGRTDLHTHAQRGDVQANLLTGNALASDPNEFKTLWAVHGICMALAWVFLIPIGIAFSVARAFVPGEGNWFMAHRIINSLGVLLTIVGFAIAVHIINQEQGDTATHFTNLRHHKIGLTVFLVAVVNAAWGTFRPHAPHAPDHAEEENIENGKAAQPVVPEKSTARVLFEYGHRVIGLVAIILGWYNVSSGSDLFSTRYGTNDLSVAIWVVIAIIALATLGLGIAGRKKST